MSKAWNYLERLTRYPHRGVGSREEAEAAQEAAGWLEGLGYQVKLQRFDAPQDTLYMGPATAMVGCLVAAGIAYLVQPWVGLVISLLVLIPLVGEMLGRGPDLDIYVRKVASQNVIARTQEQGDERLTLVISGHLDTQRATWLFHPRMAPYIPLYFNLAYGTLGLMLLGLLLWTLFPATTWPLWLAGIAAVGLVAHIIFLVGCKYSGTYINGANDNSTGAALTLALAEHFAANPVPGVRLHFLLTGAEEVGTRGMKHFMKGATYDRASTYFINLDNLGGGRLHYLEGEGMTLYHRFGPDLLQLAEAMAEERPGQIRAKHNLLLPTDGMIPAVHGYQAISFLAFQEDGSLPHYHWYTDTLDRVDRELVADVEAFLQAYVERLCASRGLVRG